MKLKHISRNEKDPSTVVCAGRYGLVSRRRVIPTNPRTQRQTEVRWNFADQARRFGELTDAQREAWNAAAATYRSHPRQGQSGPLTGLHLFIRVNCKLALFGLEPLNTPPPPPVFPELAPQDLVITNTAGVIAVKLVCPADPGDNTVLRASPPQSAGRRNMQGIPHHRHVPGAGGWFSGHHGALHRLLRPAAGGSANLPAGEHDGERIREPAP